MTINCDLCKATDKGNICIDCHVKIIKGIDEIALDLLKKNSMLIRKLEAYQQDKEEK